MQVNALRAPGLNPWAGITRRPGAFHTPSLAKAASPRFGAGLELMAVITYLNLVGGATVVGSLLRRGLKSIVTGKPFGLV